MKTPSEIRAMDLRRVCIHEAGHLIALQALGGTGHMRVDETGVTDGEIFEGRSFRGYMEVFDHVENRDHQRIVAMAGLAAEYLDEDPNALPSEMLADFEEGLRELSETDAQHGVTEEAVEQAFNILRERWADVLFEAENGVSYWQEVQS